MLSVKDLQGTASISGNSLCVSNIMCSIEYRPGTGNFRERDSGRALSLEVEALAVCLISEHIFNGKELWPEGRVGLKISIFLYFLSHFPVFQNG